MRRQHPTAGRKTLDHRFDDWCRFCYGDGAETMHPEQRDQIREAFYAGVACVLGQIGESRDLMATMCALAEDAKKHIAELAEDAPARH
jgi:hypothetical protein